MAIFSLIYLVIYSLAGHFEEKYPQLWSQALYLGIVCLLALVTGKFYKTDKVFIRLPKEGKAKILTIIFLIMLVVLYLLIGSVKNWIDVFNSIPEMMWTAIFVALAAGLEKNFYVESYYLIYLLKSLKVKNTF